MGKLMQAVGQPDLVEDFEHRGMYGITAEVAVEILMGLEEHHVHSAARQQQG
jgi:hypothetical protein